MRTSSTAKGRAANLRIPGALAQVSLSTGQGTRIRFCEDSPSSSSLLKCPGCARRVKGAYGVASRSASLTLDTTVPARGSAATRRTGVDQEAGRAVTGPRQVAAVSPEEQTDLQAGCQEFESP